MLPVSISTHSTDSFDPDPGNPRKDFPENEQLLLGTSLKKRQRVPLLARKSGTSAKLIIVDGERRWRAAKLVGLATLDAIILEDTVSPAEVKEIQLVTALHRADLKPFEVYLGFVDWLKVHPGKTGKDLGAAIDRSEAAVSMTLSLHRCIPAVKEAAKEGKIGLKDWYAISQGNEQQQAEMLAARLNGTPVGELKRARRNGSSVRTAKLKCAMPGGVVVTLTANGEGVTLDEVEETLVSLLKEVRKGKDQGLDSKTFGAVLRDKARV